MTKQQAGMLWAELPAGLWKDPTLSDGAKVWLAFMVWAVKAEGKLKLDGTLGELCEGLTYHLTEAEAADEEVLGWMKELADRELLAIGDVPGLQALLGIELFGFALPYKEYLRSPQWSRRAREARARVGNRCQLCNRRGKLHVHHRTYARLGFEADTDLFVLCEDCHARFHDKLARPPREEGCT